MKMVGSAAAIANGLVHLLMGQNENPMDAVFIPEGGKFNRENATYVTSHSVGCI